jgi:hypothetical protein
MKKTVVAAVALTGAAALSGAAILPGAAAQHPAAKHVMRFVSVSGPSHDAGRFGFVASDTDKRAGKVIGYDALSGTYNPKSGVVKLDVGLALKGGLITVHISQKGDQLTATGRITGGSGVYKGIRGTVATRSKSENSKKTFVTLRYTL